MIRKWFSRGRRPFSKKNARKSVNLLLESLEVRLAPAVLNVVGSELDLTASTSVTETITVTAPSANTLEIAVTTPTGMTHTISLQGLAATDTKDYSLSPDQTDLKISNVNTSGGAGILIFDVFLPNSTSSDTLNFGLANDTGINNVSISGPTLTTNDTSDTVAFSSLSIPGNLNVSGGTISFQAGDTLNAPYMGLTSASAITLSSSLITNDLNVSAETINIQGTVGALDMSLTSVNSLTFSSTGVPYLGPVTINAAPPTGQPFAGDPYITGPDWGAYDYAPGDKITIANATNVDPTTDYVIKAIIGDNLYLAPTPAVPPDAIASGGGQINDGDVTVACDQFTPEIEASSLSLTVTNPGSSISGAITSPPSSIAGAGTGTFLSASTVNGNITLQDVATPTTTAGLTLGKMKAGTGTIQLDVNGAIEGSVDSVPLTAGAVDLITTGSASSIGASDGPISTAIAGVLTARTNDGGIYIADSGPGLTINSVMADQMGQAPVVSNGQIVYDKMPGSSTPDYESGDEDVSISSSGPIVLNTVTATGNITVTSSAYILEGNEQAPNIVAQEVDLIANGTAGYQG